MRLSRLLTLVAFASAAAGIEPETAQLSFDSRFEKAGALEQPKAPAWVTKVDQQGGSFCDDPHCWRAPASAPKGVGRLSIAIDRKTMNEDLVATILFEASESADLVVQLFDSLGRAVEVDLFGNLVDVGKEATTDTFIIPLRNYPTAERIVLRRVVGEVKVYGVVLYPAVTEGKPNNEELKKLAAVLNDPLSPENPLLKGLQQIAKRGNLALEPVEPTRPAPAMTPIPEAPPAEETYPGAMAPLAGAVALRVPANGLVAYWNFEHGAASVAGGRKHNGRIRGGATIVPGIHGHAIRLRKNPSVEPGESWDSVTMPPTPDLDLKETMTVAAWAKYSTIAPTWGSQIAWFGDPQLGRDPWELHLYPDGTLEFRTDRSVTGKPEFAVFDNEIQLSSNGEPMANQHVAVWSPKRLAPETWYFVAGTIEKISPRLRALKLYVNGEMVSEVKTAETVNYPTRGMWMTIGAVDEGTWQNFDGLIDEVRVYNRALSASEISALYNRPWQ